MRTTPAINRSSCPSAITRRSSCKRCSENCPYGAIEPTASGPRIDRELCVGCGVCEGACPAGAVQWKNGWPGRLIRIVETVEPGKNGGKQLSLACEERKSANIETLPCIGGLSWKMLLAAAASGIYRLRILTADCPSCVKSKAAANLEKQIEIAESIADIPVVEIEKGPVYDGKVENIERRRLFGRIGAMFGEFSSESPDNGAGAKNSRKELLKHLEGIKINNGGLNNIPDWACLRAASECPVCDACSLACPKGALIKKEEKGALFLEHDRRLCVACLACVGACVAGLIEARGKPPVAMTERLAGVSEDARRCAFCGDNPPTRGSGLCPDCLRERVLSVNKFNLAKG